MGVFTVVPVQAKTAGSAREHTVDLVGPASYTAGGELLAPRDVGLAVRIDSLTCEPNAGRDLTFNQATGKVQAWAAAGTELSGNLSAVTWRAIVSGV